MEDKGPSSAKMEQGVPPGDVAQETKMLGHATMETMPIVMASMDATSMEQTLAFRKAGKGPEEIVQASSSGISGC